MNRRGSIAIVAGLLMLSGAIQPQPVFAQDSTRYRAHALVDAAIQMTDSNQAIKLLWQATDIEPTLNEPYIYLALFYNSREDFAKVVEVYKKLVKYSPKEVSAYLNIGEAYMSYSPPRYDEALPFYRKARELEPHSSFASLRIGQILARQGERDEAIRYLKEAASDPSKGASMDEAKQELRRLGSF